MKFDTFTRTVPWYEITPKSRFIYKDKVTKLYFVILSDYNWELQGAGYQLATAYRRLKDECNSRNVYCPAIEDFATYDNLTKIVECKVKA